jgi:nitrite reductase/ring-hydroxylating ferredoxin subunit
MRRIALFNETELQAGEIRRVVLNGLPPLAIYNLGGEFKATDDTCTHGAGSLAEGMIDGDYVLCPYHGGTFDIRTGEPRGPPCSIPLQTYPLEIHDGVIYLLAEVES